MDEQRYITATLEEIQTRLDRGDARERFGALQRAIQLGAHGRPLIPRVIALFGRDELPLSGVIGMLKATGDVRLMNAIRTKPDWTQRIGMEDAIVCLRHGMEEVEERMLDDVYAARKTGDWRLAPTIAALGDYGTRRALNTLRTVAGDAQDALSAARARVTELARDDPDGLETLSSDDWVNAQQLIPFVERVQLAIEKLVSRWAQ